MFILTSQNHVVVGKYRIIKLSCDKLIRREKLAVHNAILPSLLDGVCDMVVWSINQNYLEKNISSQQAKEITFHTVLHDKSIAVVSATSALAKKEKLSTDDITSGNCRGRATVLGSQMECDLVYSV